MHTGSGSAKRFVLLAMLAPIVAACTTTSTTTPDTKAAEAQSSSQRLSFGSFARSNVEPELAKPCITAAANRYYIPERVITAVDSRAGRGGNKEVMLKVDLRDARCTISANGTVRSIVDTSPMSADQKAANEAAAAKKSKSAKKKKS